MGVICQSIIESFTRFILGKHTIQKLMIRIFFCLFGWGKKGLALIIPTVSPKKKYFKTQEDYETMERKLLKSKLHYYLESADLIVLIPQIKTVSDSIVNAIKLDADGEIIKIPEADLFMIKKMYIKFIENVI